jgi:hypothetical protein
MRLTKVSFFAWKKSWIRCSMSKFWLADFVGDIFVSSCQLINNIRLCHIVHGPHNQDFHALWNQLRDEHLELTIKGYTGEGFLTEGKRLGGQRVPQHEARRLARIAAEKRRSLAAGSGQRLGGHRYRAALMSERLLRMPLRDG